MCDQQSLRSACAYAQSDQSLCLSLEYSMIVKLLTENHLKFKALKQAAEAHRSLHLSKCHIVGNHMSRLEYFVYCNLLVTHHIRHHRCLIICKWYRTQSYQDYCMSEPRPFVWYGSDRHSVHAIYDCLLWFYIGAHFNLLIFNQTFGRESHTQGCVIQTDKQTNRQIRNTHIHTSCIYFIIWFWASEAAMQPLVFMASHVVVLHTNPANKVGHVMAL